MRTERAIQRADVCVLVVDSGVGVPAQDLRVAQRTWEQGAALIVAVNKWDLISDKDANTAERGRKELANRVPFFKHVPFVYMSATSGMRGLRILRQVFGGQTPRSWSLFPMVWISRHS